jgi:transposase
MRGADTTQYTMLTLRTPEYFVPKAHPLRELKTFVEATLKEMSPLFDEIYCDTGRDSIPPERLLKASLLMALYTVRSERLFCEQLGYNSLFRWFLGMNLIDEPFDHSTFSKNRGRLLENDVAGEFFRRVVQRAKADGLMSDEHFTVDGTLVEAWASLKSFRPKGEKPSDRPPPDDPGNPTINFRGEKRNNETHASTSDPEAMLARKGDNQAARMSYSGHALMENRNGLLVDIAVAEANGYAERDAAIAMIDRSLPGTKRITLGADKGYDDHSFVERCRDRRVTPHVAQNERRPGGSAIDRRTTTYTGYAVSQRKRKRVEEIFGWMKTIGNFRKTRYRGRERNQMTAYLIGAAYNLIRMVNLRRAPA